ncbi:MAG: hypothetical protein AAFN79_07240 [Pseudomonadota bacterium]
MIAVRDTAAAATQGLARWRWSLDWALSASVVPLAMLVFAYAVYDATAPSAPPANGVWSIIALAAAAIALAALKLRELKRLAEPNGRRAALALSVLIPLAAIACFALLHHSIISALAHLG